MLRVWCLSLLYVLQQFNLYLLAPAVFPENRTKTYHCKSEDRTQFIATTSRYNLGYIGRGYDIYSGNPLSDDGVVDQGFRLPVIDLSFSFPFSSDSEYRIPDNVDVISETSASFASSFYKLKLESDYQNMLKADASVNVGGDGWGVSAAFSASVSYQKQKREIEKQETISVNMVGRSTVYRARLSSTAQISKVSDFFENAITALPSENCEEESIQERYLNVIQEYGTHYTTEVVMGAKSVQSLIRKNSYFDRMASAGISAMVAAQLSFSGIGDSANGEVKAGFVNSAQGIFRFPYDQKDGKEYYIGGNPPSGDYAKGSTERLREWARSAAEKPVPIQYKLGSIDQLIMPEYFRNLTYGFYDRRRCMRQALVRHCRRSISPYLCISQEDEEREIRRKKRATSNNRKIQFGDFVTLTNKNDFLVLSGSHGYATGTATKPLTLGNQLKNYDGLFQIMPLEEQYEKLQTNLGNGEPFTLRTVEGDEMFLGRLHTKNIDSASVTVLNDIFGNKDLKKQLPNVGDFFIFLKKDHWTTYIVSVSMEISRSKWRGGPITFNIKLEGENGLVETTLTVKCTFCLYWRNTIMKYHRMFVAEDVGIIQNVQITGMYSGQTSAICELFVKVIKNGQRTSYDKDRVSCGSNSYTCTVRSLSRSTRNVELDMYPVQFAFQSKTAQQSEPVTSRDVGYMNLVSSVPRASYWGNPNTHLMRAEQGMRIGVWEEGPMSHLPVSTDCSSVVYPDNTKQLSMFHKGTDYSIISFDVTVMLSMVEIHSNDSNIKVDLEYIDRNTDNFAPLTNLKSKKSSRGPVTITTLTLNQAMYVTALKFSNITDLKAVVIGCPGAVFETGNKDKSDLEWQIRISENEIQTYPFLSIISEQNRTYDIKEIIEKLDEPVSDKVTYSIPGRGDCVYDAATIRIFLLSDNSLAALKFDDVQVSLQGSDVKVTLEVTALNQREHELAMMYLHSRVTMAVQSVQCGTDQISLSQTSSEAGHSTAFIAVIVTLSILLAAVILVIVFIIRRKSSYRNHGPSSLSIRKQQRDKAELEHFKDHDDREIYENKVILEETGARYVEGVRRPLT